MTTKTKPKPVLTLGQRIESARKAAGLTRRAVAEKLGIDQGSVYKWERGLREPTVATLRQIADALGVAVGELVC